MSWQLAPGHTDTDTCTMVRDRSEHLAPYDGDVADRPRAASPADDLTWVDGVTVYQWTDRLVMAGAARGINRQCSIGYHNECSNRDDGPAARCRCECHAETPEPPLWAGTDLNENEPVVIEVYDDEQVHIESREVSLLALNRTDAAALGAALTAWAAR